MNRVMATGVFDLLHLGHIHYLQESKSLGDYMIVVVATDEMARKNGKELIFSEDYRRNMVSSIRYVDDAIIGNQGDIYKTVEQIKPDIITLLSIIFCLIYLVPVGSAELNFEHLTTFTFSPRLRHSSSIIFSLND